MTFEQVVTGVALLVAGGCYLYARGVRDGNQRPLHITQTVTQTNATTGGGPGAANQLVGLLAPIVGLIALAVIAVAAISAGVQSAAQVSGVAQQALTTQRDIVQAYPQPQPPVIVDRPVLVAQASHYDLLIVAAIVIGVIVAVTIVVWGLKPPAQPKPARPRRVSTPAQIPAAREVFGPVEQPLPDWIRLPNQPRGK